MKDRIGVSMIEAAERDGIDRAGRTTIVEATSGNTGIALAFVCAAKGYELVLTMPQGMSREREGLLRLYGAQVEITESLGGMNEAVDAARAMATGDNVFLPDQFSNPANPEIHRRTTGPEIWDAMDGRVDAFVVGVGTGGTITGAGEVLKARNSRCRVIAVEPARRPCCRAVAPVRTRSRASAPGSSRRAESRRGRRGDRGRRRGRDRDRPRAARREGVLAGISGGAAVWAAIEVARRPESRDARIVTILPDSGERYVSTPFFAP